MKEITPDRYRCGFTEECSAAFQLEDGRILLIGKKADSSTLNEISGRIGVDEYAVILERDFLESVICCDR